MRTENNPGLVRPRLDYEPTSPRLVVDVDRDKAATLGVSVGQIGDTLQTMLGSTQNTTYVKNGQEYDVILQTELAQRRSVSAPSFKTSRTAPPNVSAERPS